MTRLSRRTGSLAESVTMAVDARAKALRANGESVIGFGIGEPDFDTPEYVKQAARDALKGRIGFYTPVAGTAELREAVAATLRRDGVDVPASRVVVTCGAKHAIYGAVMVLVDDGDEVVIPAPYWVSYPSMVQAAGGVAVPVDTTPDGFVLTPERLARALTPRTKLVVVNSPGNPSGVTYSRAQLQAIGRVLEGRPDVTVLSDEIYQHLVYDGATFTSFAAACPSLAGRTVTVSGVSKSFAMTGWRIGWAAGPKEIVDAMIRFQSHATSNPAAIAQAAAFAALKGPLDAVEAMRRTFDRRRRLMVDRLSGIRGLRLHRPNGAFYCFPDVSALLGARRGTTSLAFAENLLERERVATVPGEAFGAPGFVRLSYACADEEIEEGCARLRRFAED
jgi:aspartate aminotransferase